MPIGFCLYYKAKDSDEGFGLLPLDGVYGIDYLIGKASFIGKGFGKKMVASLIKKIFKLSDAKQVTAQVDKQNFASQNTLLSCGFTLYDKENCRFVCSHKATTEGI